MKFDTEEKNGEPALESRFQNAATPKPHRNCHSVTPTRGMHQCPVCGAAVVVYEVSSPALSLDQRLVSHPYPI